MNPFAEQRIEEIKRTGYNIDFSELWGNGFKLWKRVTLPIFCGYLIMGAILTPVFILLIPFLYGMGFPELIKMVQTNPVYMQTIATSFDYQLKVTIISVIIGIIMAPITPGFIKMCYDADFHDKINFGAMFKYYQPKYFWKLIVLTLIIVLTTTAPGLYLQQLGFGGKLGYYALASIVSFSTILCSPLIIFADASPFRSIKDSLIIVFKGFAPVLGFVLLGILFSLLGFVLCCIGLLFSLSYMYITIYLLYKQTVGFEKTSEEITATEGIVY